MLFAEGTSGATRRRSWLFVIGQFALLGLVVALPAGDAWQVPDMVDSAASVVRIVSIGLMVVAAIGLGRSLSPFPAPSAIATLRTGGAYRYVRHPIYTGLILLAAVWAATSGNPLTVLAAIGLAGLLDVKARWEERRLLAHFDGYRTYAARTGRLAPGVGRIRP